MNFNCALRFAKFQENLKIEKRHTETYAHAITPKILSSRVMKSTQLLLYLILLFVFLLYYIQITYLVYE